MVEPVILSLDAEQLEALQRLGRSWEVGGNADFHQVLMHLINSAVDGVRRPGSWERQWLIQVFGEVPEVGP